MASKHHVNIAWLRIRKYVALNDLAITGRRMASLDAYCKHFNLVLPTKKKSGKFVLAEYRREGSAIYEGIKLPVVHKIAKPSKEESLNRKAIYYKYLESPEWAKVRLDLFALRGKKCERCGNTKYIQVHHKHYLNIFKEKLEDLEVLCRPCHRKEHGIGEGKKKPKLSLAQKLSRKQAQRRKTLKRRINKWKRKN